MKKKSNKNKVIKSLISNLSENFLVVWVRNANSWLPLNHENHIKILGEKAPALGEKAPALKQ